MNKYLPVIQSNQKPRGIVLFGGGGVSTCGLLPHFNICANVEYWNVAADAYRANYPDSHVFEQSIRGLTVDEILDKLGYKKGDIEFAQISDPCVEKSITGKQRLWHATNDLGYVGLKVALDLGVKAILCEQVDSLTHDNLAVLWSMTLAVIERYASNYHVEARILNSHNYGDNTARSRLFIQLIRKDVGFPKWPVPIPLHERGCIGKFLNGVDYVVDTNFSTRTMPPDLPLCTVTAHPALQKRVSSTGELVDLTPRDLARATGLPDEYLLLGSISNQKKIIGNGIPFRVTEALAKCIADVIKEADATPVDAATPKLLPPVSEDDAEIITV